MSDSLTTNPIVLFGDYGPEVVRYTQIYDPDKDGVYEIGFTINNLTEAVVKTADKTMKITYIIEEV